ncbi:heavy metal-responsive transcriptional regulator [Glycomyces sp. TRM65418]|uniref:heavy metal-responsive transcriptional regulator n=1 Tax=Glycomyces sp. TRM65418 TaxID=2867006 RepID=UPI001CE55C1E|nr:heavy metal-responsive transcriptional regulator [Glycomyces sp. TRM65418]MCC3761700.1 heavy metal-responsive transcriptional regulator [Glycomyces sp. TRM65418]QZD55790.1 heavy metal-responsive transcriptional regulator [Glycomyces sp. TRM65418]
MTAATAALTVGKLAEQIGVTPDAIRYWEREGLFPAPERSPSGYRRYGADALDRARFIRACQRAGLRLSDIADLLSVRDTGTCPCEPAETHLERRIAEVTAEIARLEGLRSQLTAMLGAVEAGTCDPPLPENWCPPTDPPVDRGSARSVPGGGECE